MVLKALGVVREIEHHTLAHSYQGRFQSGVIITALAQAIGNTIS